MIAVVKEAAATAVEFGFSDDLIKVSSELRGNMMVKMVMLG